MIRDLFGCKYFCPQVEQQSQVVFSVYRDSSKSSLHQQYHHLEEIDGKDPMTYTKIQKSRYHQQVEDSRKHNHLFIDSEFPPNNSSLGRMPSRSKQIVWKRVRQFIKNPVLFDESMDSPDVVIGNSSDCYLLPTITALFQRSVQHLEKLFGQMAVSSNGIYMVRVNFMGAPQEVVIDDYFPVYEATNQPVFAKAKQGNEIWEMVIEKVWAKLKGSYSNIQSGLPHDVLTAFSHAPCFYLDLNSEEPDFVWLHLQEANQNKFPIVASSRRDIPLNCGIRPLQTYIVLGSYQLQAYGKVIARVMKLICPTESELFVSQLNINNRQFWDKINRDAKQTMGFYNAQDSISFYMSYDQFIKYFDSVDICHMREDYNYNYEKTGAQSGSIYFEVQAEQQGEAYFTLHQKLMKSNSNNMSVYGRMIILLARVVGDDYQYVVSKMQVNFPNVSVRCPDLLKGKYIVYTKCYRKSETKDNNQYVLAVYSENKVSIKRKNKELCESFIQRVFLSHAYANLDKTYLDSSSEDWICTKMLYNEGGFAYIAAHVQAPSNKKIRIEFDTKIFEESGFKVKEPYKNIGKGRIIAEAGKPCIIVCRLLHHIPNNLIFPPDINIQQTI